MTDFTVTIEIEVDGAWLDITRISSTCKVLWPVTIKRGREDEQNRVASTEVSFRMLDSDCLLDGENPLSVYYRKIGIATPLRVTIDGDIRAVVAIASMNIEPGETPTTNYVDIVAAGVLRQFDTKTQPIRSAAYRAFTASDNDSERIFYAPLEEERNATSIEVFQNLGSVADDQPIQFGADTDSMSSARLLTFGANAKLEVGIPQYSSTEHKVTALWRFPDTGIANGNVPMRLHCTGGNIDRIHLRFNTPWTLILDAMRGFGIVDSAVNVDWTNYISEAKEFWISIEMTQNGANVDCTVGIIREDGTFGIPTDTLVGVTIGRIYHITVGANDIDGCSFGHLALGTQTSSFANYVDFVSGGARGANGYQGEYADSRAIRVADEHGYLLGTYFGSPRDTERMGIQPTTTLGELLNDCADTDMGAIIEHRTSTALVFLTRTSLYNQAPRQRLTFSHISPGFKPVSDDSRIANDVTANKEGGSKARYVIPDDDFWHWTTQDPPDGAGVKDGTVDTNPFEDIQLAQHAAWNAHVRSWRERRFSVLTMELARSVFTSDDRDAARDMDIGDILAIDSPDAPAYIPYDEIRMMIQGYTEVVSRKTHTIEFNATPADIYEVEQVDADGSSLVLAIDDNDTSMVFTPPDRGPTWTTDGADIPYNLQVGGDPVRVTAISENTPLYVGASASAQHADNASVTPALPAGILNTDLLLIWATVRNSGTGTIAVPSGWLSLVEFANCNLLYRYNATGVVAPAVSAVGGVAGATVSAKMFAFGNLSHKMASGTETVPAAHTQLNGSVQDIAYPGIKVNRTGCTNLIFAWKQDDWTSVAPPSGYTEVSDDPTLTGSDQGIYTAYDLTGATAGTGTLSVTGGAVAISRAVLVSLRPTLTATVTRGIAGIATSHAIGAEVRGWRMGVNGL